MFYLHSCAGCLLLEATDDTKIMDFGFSQKHRADYLKQKTGRVLFQIRKKILPTAMICADANAV